MLNKHSAWAWDAFDFFTVSLTATEIATQFDKKVADVTWVSDELTDSLCQMVN